MDRVILHVDLNAFYASVECASRPELCDKPVVVGGDAMLRHGIVLAKNERAKKHGIVTGDVLWQAYQKCPGLICLTPDYEKYLDYSRRARNIYERYSPLVEPYGIDEVWIDITQTTGLFGDGLHVADEIRETLYKKLGITASVGVSFNKIFAKLGSDYKKPNATTLISRDNFREIVRPLPAGDLLYVGRSTAAKLKHIGIHTIGQLADTHVNILNRYLGVWGGILSRFANGLDDSPVTAAGEEAIVKSIGNSITLPRDITAIDDVKRVMYMLSESVAARLRAQGLKATTVQIYIRDNTLISGERQSKLPRPTHLSGEIAKKAMEIFMNQYILNKPIRSLGVRACHLVSKDAPVQFDLFSDPHKTERLEALECSLDALHKRYGYQSVRRGILFEDLSLTGINPGDHTIHPVIFNVHKE